MIATTVVAESSQHARSGRGDGAPEPGPWLRDVIHHAAHLLPTQGPINVFIHHNTCHAFEDLPFEQAVIRAHERFGNQPYLPEETYRQELRRGRIRPDDLAAVLIDDLGDRADELLGFLGTRFHLRQAMLQYALQQAPRAELEWFMVETDALRRFRDDAPPDRCECVVDETRHWVLREYARMNGGNASNGREGMLLVKGLVESVGAASMERWDHAAWTSFCLNLLWQVCLQGVSRVPAAMLVDRAPVRHRDLMLQSTGEDVDRLVHDVLIRFNAAFLDQGLSNWRLPARDGGYFAAFLRVYGQPAGPLARWMSGLARELHRLHAAGTTPLESIDESLRLLGVADHEAGEFITATLLTLPGWGGMLWQMETNAEWSAHPAPPGSLEGYLAVRLVLERLALAATARDRLGYQGPLDELRDVLRARLPDRGPAHQEQRAFVVFQLAQVLGWSAADLSRLSRREWTTLVREIEEFAGLERRRIYHLAYERQYRHSTLDAISVHAGRTALTTLGSNGPASGIRRPGAPDFQVVCCIDEREESFRRHIEELAPNAETFAAAGFFAVAIYYRGVADAHFVPLCPIVIRPRHWVREEVVYSLEESHRRREKGRRMVGSTSHQLHVGSRSFAFGALTSAILGPLASIPLVARVLLPRWTAQIRRLASRLVQPPPITQLRLERTGPAPGPGEDQLGFAVSEMGDIVERVLRDIGLTSGLARLVIITGHGSSSLNNPHESAHDCGACGGGRGGPNARSFARMANDPRVRALLSRRGLAIPETTVFVGAYHNTCDESITYYDLDHLPATHVAEFERARDVLEAARERNAHERCRRFESAPLTLTGEEALRHVEARSEDLAQTRPEYGHATNAICIVGRRERTRGLFMDRRAFLTSYDPTQDDSGQTILTRILQAVFPVCAGINLEYYFCFVDPPGWGCGTKLPHNITSLLGVMDGAASDLRSGLPWQMVEIHEPVRLLFVIETTPDAMLAIMDRNEPIARLARNEWVQVATLDPESSTIHLFKSGRFERYQPESTDLPVAKCSTDWYRGWRDHLGFASIGRPEHVAAPTHNGAVSPAGAERLP